MKKTISILFTILLFSGCTINVVTSEEETETPEENAIEEAQPQIEEEDTKDVAYWEHTEKSDESLVGGIYEGEATINGWVIKKDFYDNEETFFHISEESFKNLPVEVQTLFEERPQVQFQDCYVMKNNQDVTNTFSNSSMSNPATIVIDKIGVPIEGAIMLNIKN